MLFAANTGVWGDLCFYMGGACRPPCRAVGLPAAPPPGSRGLHTARQRGGRAAACRAVGVYMQLKFLFYRMEAPIARQGDGRLPQYKSRGPPHLHLQQTTFIEGKKERRGVREGVATAKPCRILDPNRR